VNKKTYLNELAEELKSLPLNEQREVLEDYDEHFNGGPLVFLKSEVGDLALMMHNE
jgi:uncharacterized membrane protein